MLLRNNVFNRIVAAGVILSVIGGAAGCGASSAEPVSDIADLGIGGQTDISIDYVVSRQIPNILVDQTGFKTTSDKTAVFRGENLPKHFYVYDIETNEPVYEGDIMKSAYNAELDEYDSLGYFSNLDREGSYYIYTDVIGESYSFSVAEDIYSDLFDRACKMFYVNRCGLALSEAYAGDSAHSACHTTAAHLQEDTAAEIDVTGGWHMDGQAGRDTALGCRIAENLLLAYEMNPGAFTDDVGIPESGNDIPDIIDEVRYEAEWLLKMQNAKTGGLYGAAITDGTRGGDIFAAPVVVTPVSMEATINFAAMMARFSYIYQQYDSEFATTCLKAADRAWACYLSQSVSDNGAAFKAAAELYRATGAASYNKTLEEYFASEDFFEAFTANENIFLGGVTYLSTSHTVNTDVCTQMMKALMKKSEAIASSASKSSYQVVESGDESTFAKILEDMRCLTITDHIIYNHEYTTIIENHLHYLMGMNPDAINYVTDITERTYLDVERTTGILNNPENDALFIFMLSVLEQ